jgi:hypothetical protein
VDGVASEGAGAVEPVAVASPLEVLSTEFELATLGGSVEKAAGGSREGWNDSLAC